MLLLRMADNPKNLKRGSTSKLKLHLLQIKIMQWQMYFNELWWILIGYTLVTAHIQNINLFCNIWKSLFYSLDIWIDKSVNNVLCIDTLYF